MKTLRNPAVLLIVISLITALAILAASRWLDGNDSAQTVTYILIAIWWIPFSILATRSGRNESKK